MYEVVHLSDKVIGGRCYGVSRLEVKNSPTAGLFLDRYNVVVRNLTLQQAEMYAEELNRRAQKVLINAIS